jgi:type III restriction enzyme
VDKHADQEITFSHLRRTAENQQTTGRQHPRRDDIVRHRGRVGEKVCAKAIANGPPVSKARVRIRKADLSIGQGGVEAKERDKNSGTIVTIEEGDIALPDVLTDLQDRTQLTRKSLVRILTECGRLNDFKRNPQAFIEIAGEVINRTKRLALVDGIKY